ncbi:hypothetical protein LR48_Vigan11g075000 [Vigna angularis]|uniref:Uncharacterized protein n=1 Tax=Phaseolus angularis TaxID=3914 RepID=A0A0L9VS68_PHAAN|nr:hypothetical protein LR48_Vigan11g075000 [Vigna angularis]
MDPCTILDCTPELGEERGRSSNFEALGVSTAGIHREITTMLSGESAFLYGNVVTENLENPSSSSPSVSGYDWASRDLKEAVDAHSQCEQRQNQSEQLLNEARLLLGNLQKAGLELKKEWDQLATDLELARKDVFDLKSTITALRAERDALLLTTAEDKELKEEMSEAIVLEHTQGFKSALRQVSHLLNISTKGVDFDPRKDVYEGRLVPLSEILEGALLESEPAGAEEEVIAETVVAEEIKKEASAVPSIYVADVVHVK